MSWNKLILIISKLSKQDFSDEDIKKLSNHDRCKLLNNIPVLVARHFQYQVEVFFKEIIVDGPLGKVIYHAIRVEFQVHDSSYIHCFRWILNASILNTGSEEEHITSVDKTVSTYLPEKQKHPQLYDSVEIYQLHRHSKTCCKYKNQLFRFNFGKSFTNRTIVFRIFTQNMPENEKILLLQQRSDIFTKVKDYINNYLNPRGYIILIHLEMTSGK